MALRAQAQHVIVVFRQPARLGVFAMADGAQVAMPETCGDSDDVFDDAKRRRIYVSCGDGFLEVFDADGYRRIAHIPTVAGARHLAVRARARRCSSPCAPKDPNRRRSGCIV
jgi:hypothetical protein